MQNIKKKTEVTVMFTCVHKIIEYATSKICPYCYYYYYLVYEAIGIAATPGLLCQPRVIVKMIVDKQNGM
jgi:hypothetical protein